MSTSTTSEEGEAAGALSVHTDGASRGNPGAAAFAYVLKLAGLPAVEEAGTLGRMTNNQAEYTALVRALGRALTLAPDRPVLVHSDSELMVKQMRGEYRVKNEELRGLYEEARALAARFPAGVTFRHVRREHNKRADALCNQALDGKRGPARAAQVVVVPPLRRDVLACLRQAREAWAQGKSEPTPESLWELLAEVMDGHGVELPPGAR